MPAAVHYPPDDHLLRALDAEIRLEEAGIALAEMPVTPHLCGDRGGVRLGVLATLTDIVAASNLSEFIHPDGMATVSLSLQSQRAARGERLIARASIVRRGNRQLIVSVEIREARAGWGFSRGEEVARGLLGFARLARSPELPQLPAPAARPSRVQMTSPAGPLDRPVLDRAAVRVVDAAAGWVEIENHAWVRNSFGTLNGGMAAILVEFAAEQAARAKIGPEAVAQDLELYYVATSGAGPIRSRATRLRVEANCCVCRVELFDSGAGDKLLAVGNVHVGPLA